MIRKLMVCFYLRSKIIPGKMSVTMSRLQFTYDALFWWMVSGVKDLTMPRDVSSIKQLYNKSISTLSYL